MTTVLELKKLAKQAGFTNYSRLRKAELQILLGTTQPKQGKYNKNQLAAMIDFAFKKFNLNQSADDLEEVEKAVSDNDITTLQYKIDDLISYSDHPKTTYAQLYNAMLKHNQKKTKIDDNKVKSAITAIKKLCAKQTITKKDLTTLKDKLPR